MVYICRGSIGVDCSSSMKHTVLEDTLGIKERSTHGGYDK